MRLEVLTIDCVVWLWWMWEQCWEKIRDSQITTLTRAVRLTVCSQLTLPWLTPWCSPVQWMVEVSSPDQASPPTSTSSVLTSSVLLTPVVTINKQIRTKVLLRPTWTWTAGSRDYQGLLNINQYIDNVSKYKIYFDRSIFNIYNII